MSVAYNQPQPSPRPTPAGPPNRPPPSPAHIQKILDENCGLIQTIQEFQNLGKVNECMSYHQALHRNLVYLAQLADSTQNISQILPPPHVLQSGQSPSMVGSGVVAGKWIILKILNTHC